MEENIKKVIFLVIAIILAIVAVKFVLWLIPVILIIIIAYYVYNALTKQKNNNPDIIRKSKNRK